MWMVSGSVPVSVSEILTIYKVKKSGPEDFVEKLTSRLVAPLQSWSNGTA